MGTSIRSEQIRDGTLRAEDYDINFFNNNRYNFFYYDSYLLAPASATIQTYSTSSPIRVFRGMRFVNTTNQRCDGNIYFNNNYIISNMKFKFIYMLGGNANSKNFQFYLSFKKMSNLENISSVDEVTKTFTITTGNYTSGIVYHSNIVSEFSNFNNLTINDGIHIKIERNVTVSNNGTVYFLLLGIHFQLENNYVNPIVW